MSTKTATKRHPAFTALENAIVVDGVAHGVTKALAIKTVRDLEKGGQKGTDIAIAILENEGSDTAQELQDAAAKSTPKVRQALKDMLASNGPQDEGEDSGSDLSDIDDLVESICGN